MSIEQERRELFGAIGRSLDVKAFMQTDGGRALYGRAMAVIEEAKTALLDVEPTDANGIRAHQMRAGAAVLLLGSLEEIDAEGEQAQRAIEDRDN